MNTQVHPSFPSVIPKAPPGDSGLLKLLQHAPDVICTIDAAGKFVFVSSASEALWGYRPEELVGRPYMELVFSEDRELTVRAASDIMEGVEMTNFHNRYVCKNGEIRPVIWSANWDPSEKLMYCVARNGTEMLQAEKVILESRAALEVSTRLLTDILESLGDGFFAMDRKWVVQYFNSKAEELTGKKREEMIGRVFWDIYPSAVYTLAYTEYHRALRENTPVRFEMYSGLFNDWFEVSAYPSAVGLSVYFRNITVKKRIQEEVRRLSLVAEHTVNSVVITDAEERITWVNQAFCRISGYTAQEVIGQRPGELLQGPETSEKAKAYLRRQIANREPFKCDIVNYSKDGRPYWVEIMGQPLFNEQGELEQFFAIQTDITERIELQRLVIEEKIDAQKEMSKAIIEAQERERSEIGKELHDNVNQVLTTVKLYIENIRDYPEMQEAFLEKSVTLAQRAINEIRFLSKQLVTPVMNDLGFRATLDELVTHYRSLNRFELLLHFTICEEKLQHGAKLNIYRIIQEQLNNIVKYAKASMVTIRILFESGAVYLSIEDNGVGFDPSVTAGGIGMNNIRNRAEVYKGVVQVHAAPGTGCRLEIRFPAEAISRC